MRVSLYKKQRYAIWQKKYLYVLLPIFILITSVISIFSIQSTPASAATSSTLNFQGRLLSNTGAVVPDGSYNIEFKLYNVASIDGGETLVQGACQTNPGPIADEDCLWAETRSGVDAVTVNNGYFSVYLGSVTAFGGTIDWDQELWLGMNIGGTGVPSWDGEMTPRFKLTAVPYAFRAGAVTDAAGNAFTGDDLVQIAPGTSQVANAAIAALRLNQTGAGGLLELEGNGSDIFTVDKTGNTVAFGTLDIKGASANVGTATQSGSLILNDGSSNTGTIQLAALGQNVTYTLPDPGQATATICVSTGNCLGSGDILQNGNTLGADIVIGTNDANDLVLETNGAERLRITDTGAVSVVGGVNLNGNLVIGDTNADRLTITSEILGAAPLVFQGATDNGFTTTFAITDPTVARTITFPDLSGTVALLENAQSFTGLKTFGAGLTITAGQNLTVNGDVITDLTGSGLTLSGSALAVSYGSGAGTAVQGNVGLTCTSGTGNLSGGGTAITLGTGGTCGGITIVDNPTFITSVTSPIFTGSGAVALSSGGAGNLSLTSGSGVIVLGSGTLSRTAVGTTNVDLVDGANTVFELNNSGAGIVNLSLTDGGLLVGGSSVITNSRAAENLTGLTVVSGGANITGGIDNNGDNITEAGSITGIGTNLTADAGVTLSSGGVGALVLDSASTGAVNIGTNANAKIITIGNVSTTTGLVFNSGTGDVIFNHLAGSQTQFVATAVPTVDLVSITNSGQNVTTADVEGLSISYSGGAAAVESAAARIDLTPGTTTGGTWSGLRIVTNATGAVSGVSEYGVKLEGPSSPGAGTEIALRIGAGWDAGIEIVAGDSEPSSPTNGDIRVFAQKVAGRALLGQKTSSGVSFPYQPALFEQYVTIQSPFTTTAISEVGSDWTIDTTASHPAATEALGYATNFATAATANDTAGVHQTNVAYFRGSVAGANGYFYVSRAAFPDAGGYGAGATGTRFYTGMTNQTLATMNGADNPAGHYSGFQYSTNRGDANWQFMVKDGTTQALSDTGVAFAINKMYDFYVYVQPQGGTIFWRLDNITDGTSTSCGVGAAPACPTANLPGGSTAMRAGSNLRTLTTTARNVRIYKHYVEADK